MSDTPQARRRRTLARVACTPRGRRAALIVLASCCFALIALRCEADQRQDDTNQAIDIAIEATNVGLIAVGTPLDGNEKAFAKSVVGCAVDGASLLDCGRKVLADQLPSEARPLVGCLLKGGDLQKCAIQGALDAAQVPAEVAPTAQCLLNSNFSAGAIKGCVQGALDGLVKQLPQEVRGITGCLLDGTPVQQCAVSALPPNTPQEVRDALG